MKYPPKQVQEEQTHTSSTDTKTGKNAVQQIPPAYGMSVTDVPVIQRKKKDEDELKKKKPIQRKKKDEDELKKKKPIQRKAMLGDTGNSPLLIDAPDSPLEKEADAVAEQVVQRLSAPSSANRESVQFPVGNISRATAGSGTGTLHAPTYMASELETARGQGQPLPEPMRTDMEGVIGTDLSGVRIHADAKAAALSEAVNAQAFTYGQDVYFNAGKYQPSGVEGRRLLGHELGHVGQITERNIMTKSKEKSPEDKELKYKNRAYKLWSDKTNKLTTEDKLTYLFEGFWGDLVNYFSKHVFKSQDEGLRRRTAFFKYSEKAYRFIGKEIGEEIGKRLLNNDLKILNFLHRKIFPKANNERLEEAKISIEKGIEQFIENQYKKDIEKTTAEVFSKRLVGVVKNQDIDRINHEIDMADNKFRHALITGIIEWQNGVDLLKYEDHYDVSKILDHSADIANDVASIFEWGKKALKTTGRVFIILGLAMDIAEAIVDIFQEDREKKILTLKHKVTQSFQNAAQEQSDNINKMHTIIEQQILIEAKSKNVNIHTDNEITPFVEKILFGEKLPEEAKMSKAIIRKMNKTFEAWVEK